MKDTFFKYYSQKGQILFIKTKVDGNYVFNLTSSEYGEALRDLFNQSLSLNDFQNRLNENAFHEFQIARIVLQKAGILTPETIEEQTDLTQLQYWTVLLTGKYFSIQFENILTNEFQVHAQVHEGGTCSPVGAVACGTYPPTTYYECAYDNTWAGLGTSC